ncbi:MAG: prephenate dehydrogenase/arogenate dehydrogenase family protein [Candidatus Woesearchaeota archaeon]
MKTIGIIGFGQMGRFIALKLKQDFRLFFFDTSPKIKSAKGIIKTSLKKVASCDIIVICVPIRRFEETLHKIKKIVKPGTLICDICSIKVQTAKAMLEILPTNVELIGLHPLFGPQSGANGINGKKIVVCPIRTKNEFKIKTFLEKKGLQVILATPDEHDKAMAKTAVLSHFIGRALVELNITDDRINEPSFEILLQLKNMLKEDSEELFIDIQTKNKFASIHRKRFIEKIKDLDKRIEMCNNIKTP